MSTVEQPVASARASVMYYDSTSKKWIQSGSGNGLSKVQIYHHTENNTFRVVGRQIKSLEVVMNCAILKGLKYFQATATFHQWRDNNQIHGLNFASKDDAETFALAMERVLDILGHSSMYLSTHRSSKSQPLYQTIGHSGVSLDDYAEYRGWNSYEANEKKPAYECGQYRTLQSSHSSSYPNTPGSVPSPSAYSQHRASNASLLQQPKSLPEQPSPQSGVPPPPPPPPPPSGPLLSGTATLPRLRLNPIGGDEEVNENSLAAALASARLKKTPTKACETTPPNDSRQSPALKGMASMMDEMTRTLARRRAQTEGSNDADSICSGDSVRSWNRHGSVNGCSPNKSSGGESPQSLRRSETDSGSQQVLVDMAEIERMKQSIMTELKKEMNKMKQDIIDAIKMELNRR